MSGTDPGTVTDPHCTGFYGETYDFMGDDGKYYNMLSTGTVQVNSRMKAVPLSDFTYVDEITVKIGNEESGVVCLRMGLDVDQDNISQAFLQDHRIDQAIIYFSTGLKNKNGDGIMGSTWLIKDTLFVDAGSCLIRIQRGTYDPEMGDIPHLNLFFEILSLGLLSDGVMPHGVVGQTANVKRVKPKGLLGREIPESVYWLYPVKGDVFIKHQGLGVIEGAYQDYEVSGPFQDDFKFNRFGTPPTVTPVYGYLFRLVAFL